MSGRSHDIPEEVQVLAGEYVLGALDEAEMRAVRRRAADDPVLAAAIAAWEQQLAPLADAVLPMAPPEALWARIAAAVAPLPQEAAERPALHAPAEPLVPGARHVRPPRAAPPRRVWPWQAGDRGIAGAGRGPGGAGAAAAPGPAGREWRRCRRRMRRRRGFW